MKDLIGVWTYWLGLASALIALIMRAFNAFGMWLPERVVEGFTVWYMSFYKAMMMFLLISIATSLLKRAGADHEESRRDRHDSPVERKFRTAKAGA